MPGVGGLRGGGLCGWVLGSGFYSGWVTSDWFWVASGLCLWVWCFPVGFGLLRGWYNIVLFAIGFSASGLVGG